MSEKQLTTWERIRVKGRNAYILWRGVIGWGVPTGILFSLFRWWDKPDRFPVLDCVVAMVTFPLGGWVFGITMWAMFERRYAAAKRQQTGTGK